MKRLVVLAALGLAGCAAPPAKPLVDLKTVSDPAAYQRDLIECVSLADYYFKSEASTTTAALKGGALAGAGAAAGVMLMGPTVSPSFDIGTGLAVGAIGGAINDQRDQEIDRNAGTGRCLQGRGYTIVNEKEARLTPKRWCGWIIARTGGDPASLSSCVDYEEARRASTTR